MLKRQMLVVSDDSDVCRLIKSSMQNHSTEIRCISSASEALDSFNKYNYCLVILDNQLSGINSVEMLRIMRLTKYVPLLLFSDPLFLDDKVKLFQAGADAIIEGRFNIDICEAQAEALVQLYLTTDTIYGHMDQITVGTGLVIIPRYRQASINGKPLLLTRKEFDLLHYFVRHQCQVLSREKLYADVWNDSFAASSDETVRVHVQRLRKKLEDEGMKCIYNVWGVGYKFIPHAHIWKEQNDYPSASMSQDVLI